MLVLYSFINDLVEHLKLENYVMEKKKKKKAKENYFKIYCKEKDINAKTNLIFLIICLTSMVLKK